MGSIPDFYVYILMRPNGQPFYVGKGSGNRVNDHEKEAKRGCECHKCRTIRKIWRSGHQICKSVVFSTRIEAEALQCEARIIETIGLRNLTNAKSGDYPMKGKVIRAHREDGLNAVEYRAILILAGATNADLKMREFFHTQLTILKKQRKYDPTLTVDDIRRIDQDIEALIAALWPAAIQQLTLHGMV